MLLDRLFPKPLASLPAPDDDYWYAPLTYDIWGEVTPDTAMQVTTVLACVRVLSETIAQLPLHLRKGRAKATDHPLYRLLHTAPNERHTSFEFREMMQGHLCLRGNGYALKRFQAGKLTALVPLHPDRVQVFLMSEVEDNLPSEGRLGYMYRDRSNRQYKILQDEMFHIRGFSLDGLVGVSPITECRRTIELSLQAEIHGIKWWKNAAKPGGVIQFPENVWLPDEDAHRRMRKSWKEAHTAEDLYTVALLEGGAEWKPMGISNEDSQWLDSRRFQVAEICRIFRMPPHMVASAIEHGNTYANVEQSDLDFIKHTMMPWFARWEQAIQRDIIDNDDYEAKFALEGFLRGDSKARAAFFKEMRWLGVLSADEIRELEDMDPITDGSGSVYHIPSNMIPMSMAGKLQAVQSTVPPQEQDKDETDEDEEETNEDRKDGSDDAYDAPEEHSPVVRDDEQPLLADSPRSRVVDLWIEDVSQRICNAEVRAKGRGNGATSWISRHRTYVDKSITPLAGRNGASLVDKIMQGASLLQEPGIRRMQIAELLRKGIQNE